MSGPYAFSTHPHAQLKSSLGKLQLVLRDELRKGDEVAGQQRLEAMELHAESCTAHAQKQVQKQ